MSFRIIFIFLSIILLFSCARSNIKKEPVAQNQKKQGTQIVLLGTGTPNADPDRSGPSVAIVVNETPYIVDFGPGVVRRAAAAFRNGVKALEVSNLKIAFLTHLHTDHTVGYPDLIFTPWVLGRDRPLEVYGPPGIKSMTEYILKAYEKDIDVRIHGLEPANTE
jgi:ribonuclease BN (tRNA processing enzyme)